MKFFKKTKVENSDELAKMSVTLPKTKVEMTVEQVINMADEAESKKDEAVKMNMDDKIKVGEEEMTVNELVEKYENMCKKKNIHLIE